MFRETKFSNVSEMEIGKTFLFQPKTIRKRKLQYFTKKCNNFILNGNIYTLAFIINIEVSTSKIIASLNNPIKTFKINIVVKDINKTIIIASVKLLRYGQLDNTLVSPIYYRLLEK